MGWGWGWGSFCAAAVWMAVRRPFFRMVVVTVDGVGDVVWVGQGAGWCSEWTLSWQWLRMVARPWSWTTSTPPYLPRPHLC
jgi:hypothetical protein